MFDMPTSSWIIVVLVSIWGMYLAVKHPWITLISIVLAFFTASNMLTGYMLWSFGFVLLFTRTGHIWLACFGLGFIYKRYIAN